MSLEANVPPATQLHPSVTLREMSHDFVHELKTILRVPFLTGFLQSNTWEYGHGYFQPENFQSLTVTTVSHRIR